MTRGIFYESRPFFGIAPTFMGAFCWDKLPAGRLLIKPINMRVELDLRSKLYTMNCEQLVYKYYI